MSVAFHVRGRVQGVGFRDGTARLAARWGVRGWVRNVRDGTVQGRVGGPPDAVAGFLEGLHRASPAGRVDGVRTQRLDVEVDEGFTVEPTVPAPTQDWPS